MPEVEGLGTCPICTQLVQVGQPARYYTGGGHGNVMAHNGCITSEQIRITTPEYQREQAHQKVAQAESRVAAALAQLNHAKEELKALDDDSR